MSTRALIEIGRQFARVEIQIDQIRDVYRALETVLDGEGPQASVDDVFAACQREAIALEQGGRQLSIEANRLGALAGASKPQAGDHEQ